MQWQIPVALLVALAAMAVIFFAEPLGWFLSPFSYALLGGCVAGPLVWLAPRLKARPKVPPARPA